MKRESYLKNLMQRRLLILYASQTGYAQETAERVSREARQHHMAVDLMSMDEYDIVPAPNTDKTAIRTTDCLYMLSHRAR
jgi:sulfite reductase alpha subunit-like flavoprotein